MTRKRNLDGGKPLDNSDPNPPFTIPIQTVNDYFHPGAVAVLAPAERVTHKRIQGHPTLVPFAFISQWTATVLRAHIPVSSDAALGVRLPSTDSAVSPAKSTASGQGNVSAE